LQKYCKSIAKVLQKYCKSIAKITKMCAYNAGDIACFITEMWCIISLALLIIFICESEEDRNNKYGEVFLFSAGITFILWVVSASIQTDDNKKPKKTKVMPVILLPS